jgi:hypothetical protein
VAADARTDWLEIVKEAETPNTGSGSGEPIEREGGQRAAAAAAEYGNLCSTGAACRFATGSGLRVAAARTSLGFQHALPANRNSGQPTD